MSAVVPPSPNHLRRFRKQLGLTVVGLATKVGVTPSTITRIETGFIKRPRQLTKEALARVLMLNVRDIFPDE